MNGDRMRELRQMLRQSQGDLKDMLNQRLSRSYDKPKISRWENGKEPIPDDVAAELEHIASHKPRNAKVFVLANQKGGVGKTTSALNLAYALGQSGSRVLLIDMDPQATATVALLADAAVEVYRQGRTMAHVILQNRPMADAILKPGMVETAVPLPFDLAASHIELSETDGRREPGFDAALREAVDTVRAGYDFIVIDAPPNLGMLTWMALAAAQEVLIPVRTEPYDTMGVGLILNTIHKVQRRLNPGLRLAGILPTQFGRRKSVDREVLAHLVTALGEKVPVLEAVPDSAVFGHAARNGRIALEASPTSSATAVYRKLADCIIAGRPLARADIDLIPVENEA
ncbi:AAA family ATPase [Nitrospirillum sp. BR 11828]|uniref:AAA family ATPase n=1 Tax=Nitrospirillum sp. BR 11828 TaxID=3104325 RepID=UPI002AC9FAF7|nr:AAA family ATPase [Nitrospirillum sp. BR 11828]MDZ5645947.1 AAA family ATPase [Nitrospirillum sp. BR 11828]